MRRSLLNQLFSDPNNLLHHCNHVPSSPCPYCGEPLDCASAEHNDKPEPGCVSICIHCNGVCQFGPDMRLLPTTIECVVAQGFKRAEVEAMVAIVKRTKGIIRLDPVGQPD